MNAIYMDIPRIYTAIAEWMACAIYLAFFYRFRGWKLLAVSLGTLMIHIIYLTATGNVPVMFWLVCMAGAIGLMLIYIRKFTGISLIGAGYCCAKAFLLAEFVASIEWQFHTFLFDVTHTNILVQSMFCAVVYCVFFFLFYHMEKRLIKKEYLNQVTWKELVSVSGIVLIAFALSNLSFVCSGIPFTSNIPTEIYNIRTLADLGGVATLCAFQSRIGEYLAEREVTAIQNMLRTQYEQYRNYQNSAEMMNMKYHDLKHQITGMRAQQDQEKKMEWLDMLEREIDSAHYKIFQTGNAVLDTILEAKTYQCQKNNIQLTCVTDGRLLDHLHVVDICTIFGNALDNAIESVILVPEEEKRLIHLSVSSVKECIFIKIENYCDSDAEYQKGELPKTSKKDKKNHGYGLKSIFYTAEKNGGTCDIKLTDHWFELKILLPESDG